MNEKSWLYFQQGQEFVTFFKKLRNTLVPPGLLSQEQRSLLPWWLNGPSVKLITHLHIILRLRMNRALPISPPPPIYFYIARTALSLLVPQAQSLALASRIEFQRCTLYFLFPFSHVHDIRVIYIIVSFLVSFISAVC
jgi:hypothetical protein